MPRTRLTFLIATLLAAACGWNPAPVPVSGDLDGLAGEWQGSYSSLETGRDGTIQFTLVAGTDSAYGDVVMQPLRPQDVRAPQDAPGIPLAHPMARLLRISFVRSEGGHVSGRLDLYEDPATAERLRTTFDGRRRGDVITGSFRTLIEGSGRTQVGEWRVERVKP